ncbi:hypothetical protein DLD82_13560 [Methanospirillum stamsii]|uniref:Glycosyl transferase family 1 domain-containing protein n=1 Tax=Methanospirillum stamsii TaxID=1277351 RepID=A0A2V2MZL6_9EURY|nr:hypothetical protein DLD82_13560 [Methanospirillum stamsii]
MSRRKPNRKHRVGVFTTPIGKPSLIPVSNLMCILTSITDDISIISANEILSLIKKSNISHYSVLSHTTGNSPFFRILNFLFLQIKISYFFLKYNKYVDYWFFFLGGEVYVIPIILSRLLHKPIICILASSVSQFYLFDRYQFVLKSFSTIGYFFADKIILYSSKLIPEWKLGKYSEKIIIAQRHFLDFTTFTITTPYKDRYPLIGYIGRLSGEKGVLHFTEALPAILNRHKDLRCLIGGDGQLKDSIESSLHDNDISIRVDLPGWISHDELPHYLNQLRLLIIPSYTEGLPNIMLEAMACGTPVLATPVGAIPDVLIDGDTGFIMENNSPECITKNVIRALNSPDLFVIAEKGRRYVEKNFSFENALVIWKNVLEKI